MNIKVGISARHVHLSKDDFDFLFDKTAFYSIKDLSQKGEFASNLTLSLKTDKNIIENVRVVGPLRDKTQVEISKTDAFFLGLNPPVRMSGDLSGSESIILINNNIQLKKEESCIIANRHIHANDSDLEKYNLRDGMKVSVKVKGNRGGILNNVIVKTKPTFNLELHIDTDEANALDINNGDMVEIIKGE